MFKIDKLKLGLAIGFAAPLGGLTLFYFLKFFPTYSVKEFFQVMGIQPTLITAVASLSLFVNAVFLTLYLNKRKDKTAIGIFIITLLYGISSLILKWAL